MKSSPIGLSTRRVVPILLRGRFFNGSSSVAERERNLNLEKRLLVTFRTTPSNFHLPIQKLHIASRCSRWCFLIMPSSDVQEKCLPTVPLSPKQLFIRREGWRRNLTGPNTFRKTGLPPLAQHQKSTRNQSATPCPCDTPLHYRVQSVRLDTVQGLPRE